MFHCVAAFALILWLFKLVWYFLSLCVRCFLWFVAEVGLVFSNWLLVIIRCALLRLFWV